MKREDSKIISLDGTVYGGFDESNHGYYPEFFVLVLSGNSKDVMKLDTSLGKAKTETSLRNIVKKTSRRGHTFLQIEKKDSDRVVPYKLIGNIVASLAEDFLPSSLNNFEFYVDGKLDSLKKFYMRDFLAEIYGFSKKQIHIYAGGKFDKKYSVVNMADGMSRYYFRKKFSAQQLSENFHHKELIYFD
jgi:hypothetical protein